MKKLTMGFIINFSYCIAMVSGRCLPFERPQQSLTFLIRGLLDVKLSRLKLHAGKHGAFRGTEGKQTRTDR